MAQVVRDAALESRTARARLDQRKKPYFRLLEEGLHLGYRRNAGSGTWMARLYGGNGKYRLEKIGAADDRADADGVTILSFSQAQIQARALHQKAARTAAGLPDVAAGPYTVKQAVDDYIGWLEDEHRSKATLADVRARLHAHVVPRLGHVRLDRLTRPQLEAWRAHLAKTAPRVRVAAGEKPRHREIDLADPETLRKRRSSANKTFAFFKAAANKAWRADKVVSDKPWRSIRPFKGVDAARVRYLAIDECRRLINACEPAFRDLVQAALHTGCRYSELARLRPDDFNPDVGTIAIRQSKSGRARHVVLTDDGAAFFAGLVRRAADREWLLTTETGAQWYASAQAKPMKAACKAARLKPAITFHGLRHTYASLTIMAGAPLLVVARSLGHTDTRMVEKHYGHLSPSFEADILRRAVPRFGGGRDPVVRPLRRPR